MRAQCYLIVPMIVLHFLSCGKPARPDLELALEGDWTLCSEASVDSIGLPEHERLLPYVQSNDTSCFGLTFFRDSACCYRSMRSSCRTMGYFLGGNARYYVHDSTVFIQLNDKLDSVAYRLKSFSRDSLVLMTNNNTLRTFVRLGEKRDTTSIDQVVLYSFDTFGPRPSGIIVGPGDSIRAHNPENTSYLGDLVFAIKPELRAAILYAFSRTRLPKRNSDFSGIAVDGVLRQLALLSKGKIVQLITDNTGYGIPPELEGTYRALQRLPQEYGANPGSKWSNLQCPFYVNVQYDSLAIYLHRTQELLLFDALRCAKHTRSLFTTRFSCRIVTEECGEDVLTDGRYFKFVGEDGRSVTLDIGYDFFERHNLQAQAFPPNSEVRLTWN